MAAGYGHTCALFDTGTVKCWGGNTYGQLGLGDVRSRGTLTTDMGDKLPAVDLRREPDSKSDSRVTQIAAGSYHTCALFNTGAVVCWGLNLDGQLGLGDIENRGDNPNEMGWHLPAVDLGPEGQAVQISAGYNHTCAVLRTGQAVCWGGGFDGQLGFEDYEQRRNLNLGDEAGEMGANLPVIRFGGGLKVTQIAAGDSATCALLDDGAVMCWGSNQFGLWGQNVMGYGYVYSPTAAVKLGAVRRVETLTLSGHACVLLGDAEVKCWGRNGSGQLGLGDLLPRGDTRNEMGVSLPAVDITGEPPQGVMQLAVGDAHSCAVIKPGKIKCWGRNWDGQLGLGDDVSTHGGSGHEMGMNLPFVNLGTGRTATQITTGGSHTCAILDNDIIKCWGNNVFGQLGLGHTESRGTCAEEMGDFLPSIDLGIH